MDFLFDQYHIKHEHTWTTLKTENLKVTQPSFWILFLTNIAYGKNPASKKENRSKVSYVNDINTLLHTISFNITQSMKVHY